jgi:hypothetical protein
VTPFDQAAAAVSTANSFLRRSDSKYGIVGSSLEDLLFHRLGREWDDRCNLAAMLEQILLSINLGKPIFFPC